VHQELVRRLDIEVELTADTLREVRDVVCHDHVRLAHDRGRQDVAIALMVAHGRNDIVVSGHERLREGRLHLGDAVLSLLHRQAGVLDQAAARFVQDVL